MKFVTNDKVVDVRYVDCDLEFEDIVEKIECDEKKRMAK